MKKFFVLLMILFVSVSFAQLDRSKRPAPGSAPEIKLGSYDSFVLKNGLKVFVVENKKLPKVALSLVVDRDPIVEGKNSGYIDAAGQLLRTGTVKRSKEKIDEEIDFIGASLNTSSTGIGASSLKKHLNKLLDVMSDIITNPNFTQPELDKIVKQTMSTLASQKDEPNAIAARVKDILFYGKEHPYGEPTTEETVKSITLDMCKNYYDTYFRPNISYLAIVGDINKKEAQKLVEKYFGSWKSKEVSKSTYPTPKAPVVNKISFVNKAGAVQSVISIGYPIELKKNSEDVIKAQVLNTILGGSFISRINNNLREKHGYTYGANSALSSDQVIGAFTVGTSVRNVVTDSAVTEIMNEMKKIRTEKVSDEELQSTKNYMTGSFARSLESPQTVANFAISIARYGLPQDFYKNYLKNLNAVTADDILATAKKYIKPNNSYVLIVGNSDEVAKNMSKFSVSGKVDFYDIYGEKYDPNVKKVPEGVTAEQVINKYIDAIGGREKLLKIQDETIVLTGSTQGVNVTVTISRKAPNKFYSLVDFSVGQQKTVFDGVKGKTTSMGQEKELTGDQLEATKEQATMNIYLDYAKAGFKLALTGMETINNKDAYLIILTSPSGKKSTHYYDVASGFLIRQTATVETEQGSITTTIDYDDYKEIDGIKVAHKWTQNSAMASLELKVNSVKINQNLSDTLFEVK
jgi:zinc protease